MKIAVIGAGAMGCVLGGFLAAKAEKVYFVDVWKAHVEKINKDGLLIKNDTTHNIKNVEAVTEATQIEETMDLVIIFVKSYHTEDAMVNSTNLIGDNTKVLTLQNGVGNVEIIAKYVASQKILAGTTAHGANVSGPGEIIHAGAGPTYIGRSDEQEKTPEEDAIIDLFNASGIETFYDRNIMGLIWDKLMVNVGINGLTALLEIQNGRLLEIPEAEAMLEQLVTEGAKVAAEMKVQLPHDDPVAYVKTIAHKTAKNRSSMLQDISKGKKTEIDFINGAIVEKGQEIGLETPYNQTLYRLIKAKEQAVSP